MAALSPPSTQRHKEKCCPQIPCLDSVNLWRDPSHHLGSLLQPLTHSACSLTVASTSVCVCVYPCIILTNTVHAWVRLNSQSILLECVCSTPLQLISHRCRQQHGCQAHHWRKLGTETHGNIIHSSAFPVPKLHTTLHIPSYMPIRTAMLEKEK